MGCRSLPAAIPLLRLSLNSEGMARNVPRFATCRSESGTHAAHSSAASQPRACLKRAKACAGTHHKTRRARLLLPAERRAQRDATRKPSLLGVG